MNYTEYTFRLDAENTEEAQKRLVDFFEKRNVTEYCIYHEQAVKTNKSHFQGIVTLLPKNKPSFWMAMKKAFNCTRYSASNALVKELDLYQRYISKDQNLVLNTKYTQNEIEQHYREWCEHDVAYEQQKKDKTKTFKLRLVEGYTPLERIMWQHWKQHVIDYVHEFLGKNIYLHDSFIRKRLIQTVYAYHYGFARLGNTSVQYYFDDV